MKKLNGDTDKGTLDTEFERDWLVGLGVALGDATVTEKLKYVFFFREKPIVSYTCVSNVL